MPIRVKQRTALFFATSRNIEPAYEYIKKLKDPIGRQKIRTNIRKAEKGNFGKEGSDYRHISGDIWELKIDYGPGYRVYFGLENDSLILLLLAGSKKSQTKDIEDSKKYWNEFKSQKVEK